MVKSTNLWKVAYEKDKKEMWVIFVSNKAVVYKYGNVSVGTYNGIFQAHSAGQYFSEKVQPGRRFTTERVGRGTPLK